MVTIRKIPISSIILLLGLVFCFINGFADENNGFADDILIPAENIDDFQMVPEFILGTPDFEKMRDLPTDSQDYTLGRKVGLILIPTRDDPGRFWGCAGFLVGPDLFMTNHHCIHDDFGPLPLEGAAIFMDYYQDSTYGDVTAGVSSLLRADALKNYALLRLDAPIGNTYGWLELDTTTHVDSSQSVKLISHPSGRSKEIVRRNSEIINTPPNLAADFPFLLTYLADEDNSFGSPVFLREGTDVIAISRNLGIFEDRNGNSVYDPGIDEPIGNCGTLMSHIVAEIEQWLPSGAPTPPTPPPTPAGNLMYWTDWETDKIQRATLNGTGVQDIVVGVDRPEGIAVDVEGGKLYWTMYSPEEDTGKIRRSNLDGSNTEDLITGTERPITGFGVLMGLALDVAGGKMYWTHFTYSEIWRSNLDGTNPENPTGADAPRVIALDVAGGKMYWTEEFTGKIRRSNLDGSNTEDLVTGRRRSVGLALDVADGKMYWTEYGPTAFTGKIRRSNLDGSNIEDLITTGVGTPYAIALDVADGKMYWTEWFPSKIRRSNLDGSNIEDLITTGVDAPYAIALGIPPETPGIPPGPTPPDPASPVVDIPDPNLRAAINEALGKAPGDTITRAEMETLVELDAYDSDITDLRGIEFAINLTYLGLWSNTISDISPLSSLTKLTHLYIEDNTISDISPLSSLTKLTTLGLTDNTISNLSPLSSLTKLTALWLNDNTISDISPLSSLTNLIELNLSDNTISDISPLSSLTNLTWLYIGSNNISDVSALASLTNLTHLDLQHNTIPDVETLERLMAQGTVVYFSGNPAFETPGPKIEDGWGWLIVPATGVSDGSDAASSGRDFLSEASGGAVTEADVAVNGASAGTRVGNYVWTAAPLNAADRNNLGAIVRDYNLGTDIDYPVAYGVVSIQSETLQETRVYIGGGPAKVWLNGTLVHRDTSYWYGDNYETAVPVTLNTGNNVLFIAAYRPPGSSWGAFFGFQDGTGYTIGASGPGSLDVNGNGQVNVIDLVLVAASYGERGVGLPADVNADGVVNVQDLIAVAAAIDASGAALPQALKEALLTAAAEEEGLEAIGESPMVFSTPEQVSSAGVVYSNVAAALADAKHLMPGDVRLRKWVPVLEEFLHLLAEMRTIPETTALLPNYPNPFNPETWIPYHLAKDAEVTLTIYDIRGSVVRELTLGHQPAGVYESRGRAAYWDGKNQIGEPVASGVYFYTITAGKFTATRKLLIAK